MSVPYAVSSWIHGGPGSVTAMDDAAVVPLAVFSYGRVFLAGFAALGCTLALAAGEVPAAPGASIAGRTMYTELRLGTIEPRGWLRDELERMTAGMTGQLDELYPEVLGPRNGWLGGDGDAWERGPYWIDGLYPLAVLTGSPELRAKAMKWIEWTLTSQREDGYIGPRPSAEPPAREQGLQRSPQEDWWPRMVMLKVLQQHHQATGDPRVIACLSRYFRHQLNELPRHPLGQWSWWAVQRGADNALVVLWLHRQTGEPWLLELARLLQQQTLPYTDLFLEGHLIARERGQLGGPYTPQDSFHCVNLAQGMKAPLVFSLVDPGPRHLAATRRALRDLVAVHGQPHGLFGGDEGMHGRELDRGSELCTAVEMMFSLEKMVEISGEVEFADRLEQIAFNVLPTQVADDYSGRQYFQQANQVQVTRGHRRFHDPQAGLALVYGVLTGYPCCTTNLHQGWPKFAQHLWMQSRDGGLAAIAYAPSRVRTTLGGRSVAITTETEYPFGDRIRFALEADGPAEFPLWLRIPGWCEGARITVNGETVGQPAAGQFHVLSRTWQPGDRIELVLPMALRKSYWHERSVAIERGPLVFALRIEEVWSQVNPEDRQRGYRECRPATPWNYALLRSGIERLEDTFAVVQSPGPLAANPWTLAAAPVELRARAVRLPQWTLYDDSAGPVPMSPAPMPAGAELESIRLIPYGCTTLRVAAFPFVAD